MTPTRTRAPIICDPAPPPRTQTLQATVTPIASRRFQLRSLQMATDNTLKGAMVRGSIYNRQGEPMENVKVTVQSGNFIVDTVTARNGSFLLRVSNPGSYQIIIADDKNNALPLQLNLFDVANTEWVEFNPQSQLTLPLAEIRRVDIVWGNDLTFGVESAWMNAQYHWSVSGGALIEAENHVTWIPPSAPGHYLLQVVADWGADGLAVDSMALAVNADGNIIVC
jgi:hypothetical protein